MKSAGRTSPTRSPGSALISLMQLHPLVPPRFPTLSELTSPPPASPAPSSVSGLFASLIGDPTVIFDDLLRNPEKYEPRVQGLLLDLMSGRRRLAELPTEEREILDRATLDWNRKTSSSPPSPSPTTSSESEKLKSSSEDSVRRTKEAEVEPEREVPSDLIPDEEMIPFWFR